MAQQALCVQGSFARSTGRSPKSFAECANEGCMYAINTRSGQYWIGPCSTRAPLSTSQPLAPVSATFPTSYTSASTRRHLRRCCEVCSRPRHQSSGRNPSVEPSPAILPAIVGGDLWADLRHAAWRADSRGRAHSRSHDFGTKRQSVVSLGGACARYSQSAIRAPPR